MRDADRPQDGADDVVDEERAAVIVADAGHHRRERAHERHEAGDDDRLGAVLVEELCGASTYSLLEDARVRSLEQSRTVALRRTSSRPGAPMTAARKQPDRATTAMFELALLEAKRPAVKSSESPGRMNPSSSPDSAKMISDQPDRAERVDQIDFGSRRSSDAASGL